MQRSIWFLFDLDDKKRGALDERILLLAERLRGEDVSVTMVFSRPPLPGPLDALRALSIDVRTLDFHSPRAALPFAALLQEHRPDVVDFHLADPPASMVGAAKAFGATTVIHDPAFLAPPRSLAEAFVRKARGLALDWLADLRLEAIDFLAVSLARFTGRDGVSVRAELALGDAPLVVSLAPLDEITGGDSLLRAIAFLDPTVHVALVGKDPCEARFRVLASRLGIAGRTHFLGDREDVENVQAAASVIVASSQWEESFALAVVEGMAAARPVIVTRTGALPAIVGEAGIVVPRNDPASLGLAIRTVLSDPATAQRLGALGRKRAEELYSMDAYVDRLLRTHRKMFAGREAAPAATTALQLP